MMQRETKVEIKPVCLETNFERDVTTEGHNSNAIRPMYVVPGLGSSSTGAINNNEQGGRVGRLDCILQGSKSWKNSLG